MKYRALRHPTRFPATLLMGSVQHRCIVLSVSTSGVRIKFDKPIKAGQVVALRATGQPQPAVVRWVAAGQAGLAFDRALSPAEVERMRFGSARAQPQHQRIGFGR